MTIARRKRIVWLALPSAFLWLACLDLGTLQNDQAGAVADGSSATDTTNVGPTPDGGTGSADGAGDGAPITDAAPPIDPLDAPDGFEATGPPPPPTCTNTDAGTFACVTTAPNGWTGPFALYEGTVADAPTCGSVTQILAANADRVASPPATCPACDCNSATGTSCGDVTVTGLDNTCAVNNSSTVTLTPDVCMYESYGTLIAGGYAAAAVKFAKPSVVGGSCTPKVAKPTPGKSAVTWNVAAVGCNNLAPSTPGCNAGSVCAAVPAPPFNAKLCIAKLGNIAGCPGAPYSKKSQTYYKSATDTRDCAACGCSGPAAAQCNITAVTSTSNNCSPADSTGGAGQCLSRDPGAYYYMKATTTLPTVTCPATGGAPTGGVADSDPVTVCCEP